MIIENIGEVSTGIVLKRGTEIEKIIEHRVPKGAFKCIDLTSRGEIPKDFWVMVSREFPEFRDRVDELFREIFTEDNPENLKTTDKIVDFAIKHGPKAAVVTWHISKRCIEKRAKKHTGRSLGDLRREYVDTHVKRALEKAHRKWSISDIEKTLKDMGVTGSIRPNEIKKSLERLNHV